MSAGPIHLKVLTHEGVVIEDDAVSIRAPGGLGSLGILRNHAPLLTTLVPGPFMWRQANGTSQTVRVGSGILEIAHNQCTVLTSEMTPPTSGPTR